MSLRRLLGWCLVGCTLSVFAWVGLAAPVGEALGADVSAVKSVQIPALFSIGGSGASTSMLGSLVVPGMQGLNGDEQAQDAVEARRMSPEAFAARKVSQTAYEHFDAAQAKRLAREAFPKLIDEPAGGSPALPAGERVVGYPQDNVAQLSLPGHKHGVIESIEPIALETSPGRHAPVDLGLHEVDGAFQPVRPVVSVHIPKRLGSGIALSQAGVSLTPVNAQGNALAGSQGEVEGTSVIYANTLTDADTLVKPMTGGFSEETVLRSVDSPRELYFRVGMPSGAKLVQTKAGSDPGAVNVVDAGAAIATVLPPAAHDAEGATVPVSMSISGDVLTMAVAQLAGHYRLPVAVDPTVTESEEYFFTKLHGGIDYQTEWHFEHYGAGFGAPEHPEGSSWIETIYGGHYAGEWGRLTYATSKESQIIRAVVQGSWNDKESNIRNRMVLDTPTPPNLEAYDTLGESAESTQAEVCEPELKCSGTTRGEVSPANNNTASYEQEAVGNGNGHEGRNTLVGGYVEITQEKGPEISFNKTSPTIYNLETKENVSNVLYGNGSWLGPHHGTFEVRASDPGLGLSRVLIAGPHWAKEEAFLEEGKCLGLQCSVNSEHDYQAEIYNNKMIDGEEELVAHAEDPAGLYAIVNPEQKIKVDGTPPHGIKVSGLQNGNELPLGEAHMKVEATDGEGTTKSSGIKSITVTVDGHEVSGSAASCPEGPCTASTEFTLAARDYSTGQHSLIVTATDNADNVAEEEFTFRVHGASPVSVGPGSVDPTDGQLTLSATDVSLGSASGVSRTYQSRNLTAGAEGPLGPQWAINLGGGESLTLAPSGNATLSASGGADTTFTHNEKGEFESPKGDSNLKLEAKEKVSGKGISEYLLTDAANGTKTKFEQPETAQNKPPTFASESGAEAGQLNYPVTDAVDSAGNVWVTSNHSDLLEKFSPTGTLLATYGSKGTAEGQFIAPWGVAIDSRSGNGDVYVGDQGNNRVEELSPSGSFIKMFGWGVSNKKDEFEICTKECHPGIAGTGNGQFKVMAGIAVDSSGNVWVADYGNDRIEEFNEKGEYVKTLLHEGVGVEGSESGKFKGPLGIAFSGGNLYVTDGGNNRVQEFSTSGAGTYLAQFGKEGSGNGEFKDPDGVAVDPRTGNLYVVDDGNDRVQEFKSSGAYITKFGATGTGPGQFTTPQGVAVNASGNVYAVDSATNNVDEWMRPTWLPTEAGGPEAAMTTTYAYEFVEEAGKTVVEPTEALAPIPAGVTSCTPLVAGCRALTFEYAKATTAKGEGLSEWGEYKGHLNKVFFHAYNTSTKSMTETAVAQYSYDTQGRLRAEWDPRISPALKTTYGYDVEGHVTAVSTAGQEPWFLQYGTIPGDASTGRLVSVKRPAASTSSVLKEQEAMAAPVNTEAPKLSTSSPVEGTELTVSAGVWNNGPGAYSYQWERCNSSGGECAPILGAIDPAYTVRYGKDEGSTLKAQVTATNADGTITASSLASSVVPVTIPLPEYSKIFGSAGSGEGQFKAAQYIAFANKAEDWEGSEKLPVLYVTDTGNNRIEVFNTAGKYRGKFGETGTNKGQFKEPTGIAADEPEGAESEAFSDPPEDVFVADSGNKRLQWLSNDGLDAFGSKESEGTGALAGMTGGQYFTEKFVTNRGASQIEEFQTLEGDFYHTGHFGKLGTEPGKLKEPADIAYNPSNKDLYVADTGNNRIEYFTSNGTYINKFGEAGTGNGQLSEPRGLAVDAKGDVWVTDTGNNRLEEFSATGSYIAQLGKKGVLPNQLTTPIGITFDNSGDIFVVDSGNNRIEKWVPGKIPAEPPLPPAKAPSLSTSSVTTIEYDVPVSNAGLYAPNLSREEVEKWGQQEKSAPIEGTAIFPPDEPQGWPAADYKRATIRYWNSRGETVNTAVPTGGISTSEYNEAGEPTRTLSADNRATALAEGCKSIAKKECKSAEVSEALDTKTEYNPEETDMLKTVGPEHKVKLSTGSEVQARNVSHYYYDDNAKEVEEKTHETYNLMTRSVDAALLSNGEEKDPRETVDSYSGQENLGWTLRKPTSATTDPGGLNLTTTTVYQENSKKESTGAVVETRSAKGSGSGSPLAPVYLSQFGSVGSGSGQFKGPVADAFDASGDLWVADHNNSRVEEFSAAGVFIKVLGWGVSNGKAEFEICTSSCQAGISGSGNGQFTKPEGIAINQTTGNVYVVDSGNSRVEEFEGSTGKFVRVIGGSGSGEGQLNNPLGIAITPTGGEVWVGDAFNERVDRFSETGVSKGSFGSGGTGNGQFVNPDGIAFSDGDAYVVDIGNDRVQEFSMSGTYIAQFGSKGTGNGQFESPYGVTADPVSGDLYVGDYGNDRIEEFTPGGTFLDAFGKKGSGNGELLNPEKVAINPAGDIYVADVGNNRIEEWEPVPSAPVFESEFGVAGLEVEKQLKEPKGVAVTASGNVDVLDTNNNSIEEFTGTGTYLGKFGSVGKEHGQFKAPYGMVVDSKGNLWVADTANNRVQEFNEKHEFLQAFGSEGSGVGQFKEPKGIAVSPAGNVYVSDGANNRVEEFSEKGLFIAAFGYGVSNGEAKFEICTSGCQAGIAGAGNGQFNGPRGLAIGPNGVVWVVDISNNRVQEFNEKDEYLLQIGTKGSGNGQFKEPKGVAVDALGNVWVTDGANDRVQEFTRLGTFLAAFGDQGTGRGQFEEPWGIAFGGSGLTYVVDVKNNRVEEWMPVPRPGNEGAHDSQTIYYSSETNAEYAACGGHPEWAGLPCETKVAAQPGDSPELPVTTLTYNIWDEVEKTEEAFPRLNSEGKKETVIRTKAQTYDSAGRALTSEEASSPATDTALPKVTDEYDSETGALEKQSATIKGGTKTITSKDNTLGQLVEYTDAEGNVAKYVYEEGSDGRLLEVSEGKGKEAESYQTYAYNATTGLMEKLVDSSEPGMAFTAMYDMEGNVLTEGYPNAMTEAYTYNHVGMATGIEYKKEKDCASQCPETWFSDAVVPSIHGETLVQTSVLSKELYTYDHAGRLIETQETPTGKDCKSRLYGYDEESNRIGETTRESSTETCTAEGGELQAHSYDSANRLIDSGVTYETFGNTTKLPAADAGEHTLTSTYYVDNQVESQKQNEQTIQYYYDPAGRTIETLSEGKPTSSKVISHYAGPGEALSWTSEGSEKWTRNIPGIDGALDAIQKSGGTPVLQLHDLEGDIVGTAAFSETETKPLSTFSSTEFGVPTTGSPPPYSWLGADGVASELSSGVSTQGGSSYVPEIGRPLQTGPIASPGSFPNGAGGVGTNLAPYMSEVGGVPQSVLTHEAEIEAAKNKEAAAIANMMAAPITATHVDGPGEGNCESNCLTVIGGGGLIVTGQYAQPPGGGGAGGEAVASAASKKRKRYNACENRFNPKDPGEACCELGSNQEIGHGSPGHPPSHSYVCQGQAQHSPSAYEPSPGEHECGEGTYPGIGAFTGRPACIPEGEQKNDPPEPDDPPEE